MVFCKRRAFEVRRKFINGKDKTEGRDLRFFFFDFLFSLTEGEQGAGKAKSRRTCSGAISTSCDDRLQGDGDGKACIELGDCSLGTQRSRHSQADIHFLSALP